MTSDLAAVHNQLVRLASGHAAGDLDAAPEGAQLLQRAVEECGSAARGDPERLLGSLLEASSPPIPDAELLRSFLGSLALESLPRLLGLAAASPRAAATAAALVERLAVGIPAGTGAGTVGGPAGVASQQGEGEAVVSPRELLTALLEVLDMHTDVAFDSPMHLLLLRLLGLMPRLVAAVQRRRLQVALSCLPAVADLAAAAAPRLAALRRAAEAMAMAATTAADGGEGAESALELWREGREQLVVPFVDFALGLQELVLATELPPLELITRPAAASAATGLASSAADTAAVSAAAVGGPSASGPPAGAGSAPERLRLAAWLLALFGALWPAWGHLAESSAAASGGGSGSGYGSHRGGSGGGWSASRPAAALLELLLGKYLPALRPLAPPSSAPPSASTSAPTSAPPPPPPPPSPRADQQQRRETDEGSAAGDGWSNPCAAAGGAGGAGGTAAVAISWTEVWEVAAGGAESRPDLEVCSDPQLPQLGAATLLWLAATSISTRAVTAAGGGAASTPAGGGEGADACDGLVHRSSLTACPPAPEPPTGDSFTALKVILEACQVLLRRAGSEDSSQLLTRALQLMAAGCRRLRRTGAVPAARTSASSEGDPDPWVAIAEELAKRPARATGASAAADLYDMLTAYEPSLDEREAALEPLAQNLAVVAALNVAHGSPGPAGDAVRTLAHGALQALLGALPAPLRALCLDRLAAGPSAEVAALALQRLQREVAAAAAATAVPGTASSVFCGPWVLRPVLQQLIQLLPAAVTAATAAGAAAPLVAAGAAAAAAATTAAGGSGGGRALEEDDAAVALTSRADSATAAVSVLRFLALRYRTAAVATSSGGDASELAGDSARAACPPSGHGAVERPRTAADAEAAAQQATTARGAVLTFVYDNAVQPLYDMISAALVDMRRRVEVEVEGALEEGGAGTGAGMAAGATVSSSSSFPSGGVLGRAAGPAGPASAGSLPSPSQQRPQQLAGDPGVAPVTAGGNWGDRFAGNVALVSDAVAGLTAVSRLQEVVDCVAELLLRPLPPHS